MDLIIFFLRFIFIRNTAAKVSFVIFSKAFREYGRFSRRRTHLSGWGRLSINTVRWARVNGTKVVGGWVARKCHAHAPQKDAVYPEANAYGLSKILLKDRCFTALLNLTARKRPKFRSRCALNVHKCRKP